MNRNRTDSREPSPATNASPLLEGILTEAREEAQRLVDEAREQAEKKRTSAEAARERILSEARRRGEEQRAAILREAESSAAAEVRRIELRSREALYEQVLNRFRDRMREIAAGDEYPRILRDWIVEGVLGLGCEEAVIEAPPRERSILTDRFLAATEAEIDAASGGGVRLSLADAESGEKNPGVVVYNAERSLAFDNRLEARIRRNRREIMRILRDALDPPEGRREKEN